MVAQLQLEGVVEEGEDWAAVAAPSDPPLAHPGATWGQRSTLRWEPSMDASYLHRGELEAATPRCQYASSSKLTCAALQRGSAGSATRRSASSGFWSSASSELPGQRFA